MTETIPNEMRVINDFRVRGKETPKTNKVREFIKNNPNCTMRMITDNFPDDDPASLRRIIRKLVESHGIVQRFSIN